MKLTTEQKQSLKSLSEHPWMRIWTAQCDDFASKLWKDLLKTDWSEEDIKRMKIKQIEHYMFQEILQLVKSGKAMIYTPEIKDAEKKLAEYL